MIFIRAASHSNSLARFLLAAFTITANAQHDPQGDSAISAGLTFIAARQLDDGSFSDGQSRIPTTALALLSLLSAGHTQDLGRYGLTVRRAVDYLLSACPQDGFIGGVDGSLMYGQAVAALALSQAFGVELEAKQRSLLRSTIQRQVAVIISAQQSEKSPGLMGGWDSQPQPTSADLAITCWSLLALQAARDIGIDVPAEVLQRGLDFVNRCQLPNEGFAPLPGKPAAPELIGIATLVSSRLDAPQAAQLDIAARTLGRSARNDPSPRSYSACWFTALAAMRFGSQTFASIWPSLRDGLLSRQSSDGGWTGPDPAQPLRLHSTSLAVLTLTVPQRTLPLFQP